MSRQEAFLPPELVKTQEWLNEMFREAGRGLPWPQQLGLMVVAQAITAGMFGGLMASAWLLHELQETSRPGSDPMHLVDFLGSLEQTVLGSLPEHLQAAVRQLASSPRNFEEAEQILATIIGPAVNHRF
jgi:hypothetical protein